MKSVVITGASGFLGRALLNRLLTEQHIVVTATVRKGFDDRPAGVREAVVGDISGDTDWSHALIGADTVIHCAARVHMLKDSASDPLESFRQVNRDGTLALARQAARAGVRRFVFLSTIGVNGGETQELPFSAEDPPAPHSPYAISKYEAELGLADIAADTGMEVVIIRPPLVYGAGAPGNFRSMVKWLSRGVPLPLGSVTNMRSYVALDNLVDLIVLCIEHPAAAGRVFVVCDGEDLSTTDFLRRTAAAMGLRARLWPVPMAWLRLAATLIGKPELGQRLCGSLQIDARPTQQILGWSPAVSVDAGLKKAVEGYRT